jgi:hypothetical protein
METNVLWTNLNCTKISELLKAQSIIAGVHVVKQLLKLCGYVKRKMVKCKTLKDSKDRNMQFQNIAYLKTIFTIQGLPILSIDSKKKEMIGDFYRAGSSYTLEPVQVYDHDFKNFAQGEIVPHGIYDVNRNECYLTIGTSKDTAEFITDNIEFHWNSSIKNHYPGAEKMLILCDGGGSNSCRHHVVKEQLQKLADRLNIEIVIAHYPAYCSKWNPIEHKAFCHISRSWQGAVFDSLSIVKELAEKTTTKNGFSVKVNINDKIYSTGKKASTEFLENSEIIFDEFLPRWNYSFKPNYYKLFID